MASRSSLTLVQSVVLAEEPSKDERLGPRIAFACLDQYDGLRPEKLKEAMSRWFPEGSYEEIPPEEGKEGPVGFKIDDKLCFVMHIPKPIPNEDIDYACGNSFLWPEAEEAVSKHPAHLIEFRKALSQRRHDLITEGNVIKDGDTIGSHADEVIKTWHEESVIGRKAKVIRVGL